MRQTIRAHALTTLAAVCTTACSGTDMDSDAKLATQSDAVLGDRLSGIDADDFAEAKAAFEDVESINDGVGPIFNERSCGGCGHWIRRSSSVQPAAATELCAQCVQTE